MPEDDKWTPEAVHDSLERIAEYYENIGDDASAAEAREAAGRALTANLEDNGPENVFRDFVKGRDDLPTPDDIPGGEVIPDTPVIPGPDENPDQNPDENPDQNPDENLDDPDI